MEEKPVEPQARTCPRSGDLRTFVIALLTSLIVVLLYHCGLGLCRMFCSPCSGRPPVRYMLVPVADAPCNFRHAKMKKPCPAPGLFCPAEQMAEPPLPAAAPARK